ncbi:MAG: DUF2256 domain-containing protein [Planctomycetota bacterium]|nr:DUF2256 domain-containing protein [Planctomycetota bacterium]
MSARVLPTKICPVCQRPFHWRKKWDRVWTEVIYCSHRCRQLKNRHDGQPPGSRQRTAGGEGGGS